MSHPYVDTKAGLTMLGGNQMIYLRLLKKYATGTLFEDAVKAVEAGDSAQAQVALHTLKGATGNLHLSAMYELTKDLESSIKQSGAMPSADEMAQLADAHAQTMAQIEAIVADPSLL